jgi:hypothetical protein
MKACTAPESLEYPAGSINCSSSGWRGAWCSTSPTCLPVDGKLPTDREEAVLGLIIHAVSIALLMLTATFCWTWRERSRRKTLVALQRERRETSIQVEREQRKTKVQLTKALGEFSNPSPQAEQLVVVAQERAQSNGKVHG